MLEGPSLQVLEAADRVFGSHSLIAVVTELGHGTQVRVYLD